MDRDDLINKAKIYYNDIFTQQNTCCEEYLMAWIDAVLEFREKTQKMCCVDSLRSIQHYILSESDSEDCNVRKNAMFGDLHEIRTKGFEARFMYNVKIFKTYKKAYEITEKEYQGNFGTRRYSSYDSFRQVRTRRIKKNNE